MNNNIIIRPAIATGLILLIPLIAMQFFPNDVIWTGSDFLVMGVLLFGTGLLIELAWRKLGNYRGFGIALIVFLFLWLWVELAVGLFTNWGS